MSWVLPVHFFFLNIVFSACYHWWICFLDWLLFSFPSFFFLFSFFFLLLFNYFILITVKFFILITLFHFLFFFLSFLLPFLLSRVADRVLVLRPGIRPVPLRWESRVQDTGPPETSRLYIISSSEISLRYLHLNAKTQLHSSTSKLQCWTSYANLARQEHNPTH